MSGGPLLPSQQCSEERMGLLGLLKLKTKICKHVDSIYKINLLFSIQVSVGFNFSNLLCFSLMMTENRKLKEDVSSPKLKKLSDNLFMKWRFGHAWSLFLEWNWCAVPRKILSTKEFWKKNEFGADDVE